MRAEDKCINCHKDVYEKWEQSRHAQTFERESLKMLKKDYPILNHKIDLTRFHYQQEQGNLYLETLLKDQAPQKTQIVFSVGSSKRGRSFVTKLGDELRLSPFSITSNVWTLEESYEPHVSASQSQWFILDKQCLNCHSTQVADEIPELRGVHCLSCHKSNEAHIKNPTKDAPSTHDYPPQKYQRCTECHSNKTEENIIHANQTYLLSLSKCSQKNPTLNCISCHSPHSLEAKSNSCTQCHAPEQKPHYKNHLKNCTDCHMPKQDIIMNIRTLDQKTINPKVRNHKIDIYHVK